MQGGDHSITGGTWTEYTETGITSTVTGDGQIRIYANQNDTGSTPYTVGADKITITRQ